MNAPQKFRAARKRLDHEVAVIDQMTGQVIGHIGNLSLTGMMLIAETPVQDDALYQLSFTLPGASSSRAIEVGVHEQWSAPGTVQGQQWVGFHFIDISEDDEVVLDQWLIENPGGT